MPSFTLRGCVVLRGIGGRNAGYESEADKSFTKGPEDYTAKVSGAILVQLIILSRSVVVTRLRHYDFS